MAKFSLVDAGEEEDHGGPPVHGAGEYRRIDDRGKAEIGTDGCNRKRAVASGSESCPQKRKRAEQEDDAITVRIDADALDCSICFEPLRPPLLQCPNGHVTCSTCWPKLQNKCHICCNDGNFVRNIALEKIIESIRIPCSYAAWGCCEMVSYSDKHFHEVTCPYAPIPCPIMGCQYKCARGHWSDHFLTIHLIDFKIFHYDRPFTVSINPSEPFRVLLGEDDSLFLLLNENSVPAGHALTLVSIQPRSSESEFSHEARVSGERGCLILKGPVTVISEWKGIHPSDAFLLVPCNFCSSSGQMLLQVCVQKVNHGDSSKSNDETV